MSSMAVYVACLACYNEGRLIGKWLDALDVEDELTAGDLGCPAAPGAHDELVVHDYDGDWGVKVGEISPWQAREMAERLTEVYEYNSHIPRDVIAEYASDIYGDIADWDESEICERYRGGWDSGADYAAEFADEIGAIDDQDHPWIVIDWQATWHCNLRHDYYSFYRDGELHIFDAC